MLIFRLCPTSDDRAGWSMDSNPIHHPSPAKKTMLVFGLCSTSDDQLSDLSDESQPKCKNGPLSHQKMKCLFLDYVQILMISQAIKVNQNVTKCPLSHQKMKCSFLDYIKLLMIGHAIQATKVD